jgi:hypothetical protein
MTRLLIVEKMRMRWCEITVGVFGRGEVQAGSGREMLAADGAR